MPRFSLRSTFEHTLIVMIGVAILWKGGKGLETTWILPLLPLLGAFAVWMNPKRDGSVAVPWHYWLPAILFILWTVISFFLSETRNYGLDEVIRDASCILLWLQLLRFKESQREGLAARLIDALLFATLFAATIGFAIYIFQPVGRFVGSFFDPRFHTDYWPNAWAELLLLVWPLGVFKLLQSEGRWRQIWIGLLGLLLGALFLSYSRGAFLACLGQAVLLGAALLWLLPSKQRDLRQTAIAVGATLILSVALFFAGNLLRSHFYPVQDLGAKVTFTADEGTSSIDEREDFWHQSWQLSLERPLFGYGPYSFRFLQPRFQTAVFATSDHPHNLWLKIAMERGWPAAILLTVVLLLSLVAGLRRAKEGEGTTWQLFAVLGVVGVLAHVLIDYNLQFVGIALPLWLLLGLLAAPTSTSKSAASPVSPQAVAELMLVLLLVFVTVHEAVYLVTSSLGRKADAHGDVVTAERWYEASDGSWFPRDLELSRAALALREDKSDEALTAITSYLAENSQDARAFSLRAAIEEDAGDHVQAARDLSTAFAWSKFNDLKVIRRWIGISQADATVPPLPSAQILDVLKAFTAAFQKNSHFVLLGDSPEEFRTICWMEEALDEHGLRDFCRANLTAVMDEAATARVNIDGRKTGVLW